MKTPTALKIVLLEGLIDDLQKTDRVIREQEAELRGINKAIFIATQEKPNVPFTFKELGTLCEPFLELRKWLDELKEELKEEQEANEQKLKERLDREATLASTNLRSDENQN